MKPCLGFITIGYGEDVNMKKATCDLNVTFLIVIYVYNESFYLTNTNSLSGTISTKCEPTSNADLNK